MKFYRFAFMTKPAKRNGVLRPHELRDGDAFHSISVALTALGHTDEDLVINHPATSRGRNTSLSDLSHLKETDLLVITSRPPFKEEQVRGVRVVKEYDPSRNQFEERVLFPALEDYLTICSRNEIVLNVGQLQNLLPGFQNRWNLGFFVKPNKRRNRYEASYSLLGRTGRFEPFVKERTTAAYLIHTPPLRMPDGRKGPRALLAFGLSGTSTLVFNYQLRKQNFPPFKGLLRDVLARPSFAMVEMEVPEDLPNFLTSLAFSNNWKYKLITRRPGEPAGKRASRR